MIDELLRQLAIAPVMGHFHPLIPLCLPANTVIAAHARSVALAMDARESFAEAPVLITELDRHYADRFLNLSLTEAPPPELVNAGLSAHPQAGRQLLTNHNIADRIVADTVAHGYRCVALILVDGLSYEDTRHWSEPQEPVFIDGPSITFFRSQDAGVLPDVGFPAIVGSTPLVLRLRQAGLDRARGYSYWDREQNDVSSLLFRGMHVDKVSSSAQALDQLATQNLDGLYIQMVRIGTDGLAHRRREVGDQEVLATVTAVHDDLSTLVSMMRESNIHGAVYLTADHGMLWKNNHTLQKLDGYDSAHPRYTTRGKANDAALAGIRRGHMPFHLFKYPYVGATIRSNDSGVHGGLSYWESIVPLVRVEVNT
jgi:hypothetical protein